MISTSHRFLFIHVPKTGGNSIQNILRKYSEDKILVTGDQDGYDRFGIYSEKYGTLKHESLRRYKRVMEKEVFESLYKFAVVRNPWDMMMSFYFSPNLGERDWNRVEFIEQVNVIPTPSEFICENQGGNLDSDIDFLMKFENIDLDFQKVCNDIGIPYEPLPVRNASNRKHYSFYYDNELIELVAKKFSKEIEWGAYEFEER